MSRADGRQRGRRVADTEPAAGTVPRETAAAEAAENLRAATREAREVLKDLRAGIAELRRLQDKAFEERVERQVAETLHDLGVAVRKSNEDAAAKAVAAFEGMYDDRVARVVAELDSARDVILEQVSRALTIALRQIHPAAPEFNVHLLVNRPRTFDGPAMVKIATIPGGKS